MNFPSRQAQLQAWINEVVKLIEEWQVSNTVVEHNLWGFLQEPLQGQIQATFKQELLAKLQWERVQHQSSYQIYEHPFAHDVTTSRSVYQIRWNSNGGYQKSNKGLAWTHLTTFNDA